MQRIINALQLGSIYALISLGYSMVYGIISLINFAHGEVIMLGGYIAIVSMSSGFGPVLSSIFSIFGCILISLLTEKIAYKPLRHAPRNSIFITAIGVSLFLQNISQIIFSANGKPFPNSNFFPNISFSIFNSDISFVSLITIIISVSLMIILDLVIKYSKLGRAMRAVSEDMQTSRLMGINIDNVTSFTFAIGAALAGIGSVLYFNKYPIVSPVSGYMPGMKAFIAAVLGKIGSIKGAVFGGFLIGFIEIFTIYIGLATWLDAIVFGILILVLIFKPSGILGKKIIEKV
ncbi:MAG: branched-chain amino acid ABC transporter permease [Clostridia bacterium]|nr:branched-chain amino acid ABC transporter permease [Clostridia bacterium]